MKRWKNRVIGTMFGVALLACAGSVVIPVWNPTMAILNGGLAAPPGQVVDGPEAAASVGVADTSPSTLSNAALATEAEAKPEPRTELAVRYRDAVCECQTRACWHEVSAEFDDTEGFAGTFTVEESQAIRATFRETSTCLRRIFAAERALSAAESPPQQTAL